MSRRRTVPAFPPLVPELRERLLLAPDAFRARMLEWAGAMPARPCGPEQLAFALGYPWPRPASSYVLRDGEVHEPDLGLAAGRHPVLAFGSNAGPAALERKFAHFEDRRDREILVLAGTLHDFDVGPAASVATLYGAMPATLFASPGTRVRVAVLFATDAQLIQLTWSELSYAFGRLEARLDVGLELRRVLAYVSRWGTFCPDGGEPLALAAVSAENRSAPARTQRQLLDLVAVLALGDGATAQDVVAGIYAGGGAVFARIVERILPLGRPFSATGWTPYHA